MKKCHSNSEQQVIDLTLKHLLPYFDFMQEVWSTDGKSRIDRVAINKADERIVFGMEFKGFGSKRGRDIGEFQQQAIRYALSDFVVRGKVVQVPIIIIPPLSRKYFALVEDEMIIDGITWVRDRHEPYGEHHTINGWLGTFGIGELRTVKHELDKVYTYTIISFLNFVVWNNKRKQNNVRYANYERALKRIHKLRETFRLTWQKNQN